MTIFEFLDTYWQAIGLLIMIVGHWIRVEMKLAVLQRSDIEQTEDICSIKEKVEAMNPMFADIKERLIAIETLIRVKFKDK